MGSERIPGSMAEEYYRTGDRDFILGHMQEGLARLKDSALFPVLVKPWAVNKVTCGSLLTFFDHSYSDVTVSLDACLIALLLINILIFAPLFFADLYSGLDGQGGGLNLFSRFQERIDRIETGFDLENQFEDTLSAFSNYTYLETSLEALKNFTGIEKPLMIIDDIKMFLRNVTELNIPEDEETTESVEESLNIYSVPLHVYKYPVDGSFGSSFHGFESEKDEVLDLSGATDDELMSFYQLPRAFKHSNLDSLRDMVMEMLLNREKGT